MEYLKKIFYLRRIIESNFFSLLINFTTSTSNISANDEDISQPHNYQDKSNYILIDVDIIAQLLALVGTCPDCEKKSINVNVDHKNKRG